MNALEFGLFDDFWDGLEFDYGSIEPINPSAQEFVKSYIEEYSYAPNKHTPAWIYPYRTSSVSIRNGVESVVPNSHRPAHLWYIPPTHILKLKEEVWQDKSDTLIPHLVVKSLAWLYCSRLFLAEHHADLRIPLSRMNRLSLWPHGISDFLDYVIERCLRLTHLQRTQVLGLLVLANRVSSYEWEWERFHWSYICVDTCWRIMAGHRKFVGTGQITGGSNIGHANRMRHMCMQLNIGLNPDEPGKFRFPRDEAFFDRAADLRNNLVHQFNWAGDVPGYMSTDFDEDVFLADRWMMGFVSRLILHVLDIPCDFKHAGLWYGTKPAIRLERRHPERKIDFSQYFKK